MNNRILYTVCLYLIIIVKLFFRHATQFYLYSTVTCDYWGVVLFFIALTGLLVFINKLTFPISHICTNSV